MDRVVAVASGKGGVGKSTVAVNLAACFANPDLAPGGRKLRVALIDTDFYGPSIPTLMGGGEIRFDEVSEKIIPALKYGVKYVSIGFMLSNSDDPVIWRGPMLRKGILQLFGDVNWGPIDICIVDLPPGTGDVQLSIAQEDSIRMDGVVMVTTPQEVALSDVRKAINMFSRVNVPVMGVIENMAGFVTPNGERYDIFGAGGGELLAKRYNIDFFGSIPIEMNIRVGGDSGRPAVLDASTQSSATIREIASKIWTALESREVVPQLKVEN